MLRNLPDALIFESSCTFDCLNFVLQFFCLFAVVFFNAVNFDHFQILRAIGKGNFGKVRKLTMSDTTQLNEWLSFVSVILNTAPKCFAKVSLLCVWNTKLAIVILSFVHCKPIRI